MKKISLNTVVILLLIGAVVSLVSSNLIWVSNALRASAVAKANYESAQQWQGYYKRLSKDHARLVSNYGKAVANNTVYVEKNWNLIRKYNGLINDYNNLAARYIATYKDAKMAEMKLGIISGVVKDFGDGMCVDAVAESKSQLSRLGSADKELFVSSVNLARSLNLIYTDNEEKGEETFQGLMDTWGDMQDGFLEGKIMSVNHVGVACMGGYKAIQITLNYKNSK